MRTAMIRVLSLMGGVGWVVGLPGCQDSGQAGSSCPDESTNGNANSTDNDNGASECTDLTFRSFACGFFDQYCIQCHSTAVTGLARLGAPAAQNFNSLEGVLDDLTRIRVRATVEDSMPSVFGAAFPTSEERDMLQEWIDCGAPE